MRKVAVTEFLSNAELRECRKLGTAKLICDKIIRPNIERINAKLRQENDPMYLAYMVVFVLSGGNP